MKLRNILLLFIGGVFFSSCQPSAVSRKASGQTPRLLDAPFPVGVAVNMDKLKDLPRYREIVIQEFSSITAENAMKGQHMQPQQGQFVWENADYLVDFCRTYNKQLHGHTLVWHIQQPAWLKEFEGDSAAWEGLMKTHIQTIVGRYKGKVKSWDVVNEAIDDKDVSQMRKTIWSEHLGDDYIARAFQYAHEADPDALLFYNDYGIEDNNPKLSAVLKMVDNLKARGIPIHGVGLQMHINHKHSLEGIAYALDAIKARGLKVHISELDLSVNPDAEDITISEDLLQKQKEHIQGIARLYTALPEQNRYALTFWGVADADTWIRSWFKRKDWPLLYDDNYQPKPAYKGFLQGTGRVK
jgi:endo-1,4-beta-xylanase